MIAGLQWVRSDNVTPLLQVAISLIETPALFPHAILDAVRLLLVPRCVGEQRTVHPKTMAYLAAGRQNHTPRLVRDYPVSIVGFTLSVATGMGARMTRLLTCLSSGHRIAGSRRHG